MLTNRKDETLRTRRKFLQVAGAAAGGLLLGFPAEAEWSDSRGHNPDRPFTQADEPSADYSLRIATTPVELAPNRIVSATTYNGQFPGPLLRFKEGKQVTIDVHNNTDTPEQLHWHGQFLPVDVDGSAWEWARKTPA